jgi:ABC-type phosphate/phosphonate transport system permease subunit
VTRLLRVSAVLTIVGLVFMVWSLLAPTPMPVILAMSIGQAAGTLAFGLYGYVVLADLRRDRRLRRESLQNIDAPEGKAAPEDKPEDKPPT